MQFEKVGSIPPTTKCGPSTSKYRHLVEALDDPVGGIIKIPLDLNIATKVGALYRRISPNGSTHRVKASSRREENATYVWAVPVCR